ncbi:NUDIX domain-containing protein [Myroides sp. LJL119]
MTRKSNIFITVDAVIIKKKQNIRVLLIKRKNDPFKDFWALPGGFVDQNEDLEHAAARELLEETQIKCENLQQIGAYGKENRDPRAHIVSIAYLGIVDSDIQGKASDDAKQLGWFTLDNLPDLAFDHKQIIEDGIKKASL